MHFFEELLQLNGNFRESKTKKNPIYEKEKKGKEKVFFKKNKP